jgi:hypothetical protein
MLYCYSSRSECETFTHLKSISHRHTNDYNCHPTYSVRLRNKQCIQKYLVVVVAAVVVMVMIAVERKKLNLHSSTSMSTMLLMLLLLLLLLLLIGVAKFPIVVHDRLFVVLVSPIRSVTTNVRSIVYHFRISFHRTMFFFKKIILIIITVIFTAPPPPPSLTSSLRLANESVSSITRFAFND